jgi:beta-N-acetylhexosaminidase
LGTLALAGCGGDQSPSAAATRAPTPSTTAAAPAARVDRRPAPAARLTIEQLAGQRIIASFRTTGAALPPGLARRIRRGAIAGVLLFQENGSTIAQVRALTRRLQAIPRPRALGAPLLIMVDQEGGPIRRLTDAPPRRSAPALAATGRAATVRNAGRATGRALREAGVNVDLAPIADIARPGSALDREERGFGSRPASAASYAAAFAAGLRDGGVHATAKHFPGFGASMVNTDATPARITLSSATLRRVDRPAFRAVAAAGAQLLMLANAIYPALDPRWPATLSHDIVTREARDRLGFGGVIVTDDLEATALASFGGPGPLAVRSARAGADLLLFGRTYAASVQAQHALEEAIRSGRLSRGRAEAAARRVIALRRDVREARP